MADMGRSGKSAHPRQKDSPPGGAGAETQENGKAISAAREPGIMLTTGEACRLLNVHSNTLRRWAATGTIKAYRVGPATHRRYRREDVAALLIEQNKFRGPGGND